MAEALIHYDPCGGVFYVDIDYDNGKFESLGPYDDYERASEVARRHGGDPQYAEWAAAVFRQADA